MKLWKMSTLFMTFFYLFSTFFYFCLQKTTLLSKNFFLSLKRINLSAELNSSTALKQDPILYLLLSLIWSSYKVRSLGDTPPSLVPRSPPFKKKKK